MCRREYQYLCSSNSDVITTVEWPCTADSCPSVVSVSYGMNVDWKITCRRREWNVRRSSGSKGCECRNDTNNESLLRLVESGCN